jgi:hypothetical protein
MTKFKIIRVPLNGTQEDKEAAELLVSNALENGFKIADERIEGVSKDTVGRAEAWIFLLIHKDLAEHYRGGYRF